MIKWEAVWDSLDIIFVQSLIQVMRVHFAIQLIRMFDGNIAIANHVIEQKVEMNVWDGIQSIITSLIARVANLDIGSIKVYKRYTSTQF